MTTPERIPLPHGYYLKYWPIEGAYLLYTPNGESALDDEGDAFSPESARKFAAAMQGEGMGEGEITGAFHGLEQLMYDADGKWGDPHTHHHAREAINTLKRRLATHPQPSASADAMECAREVDLKCNNLSPDGVWQKFDGVQAATLIQQYGDARVAETYRKVCSYIERVLVPQGTAKSIIHGVRLLASQGDGNGGRGNG